MNTSKLSAYSALAAAYLMSPQDVAAQMVYTDINPDKIVGGYLDYPLDFNVDGINEFIIASDLFYTWTSFGGASWGYETQYVSVLNYAEIIFSGSHPMRLDAGESVDSSKPFTEDDLNIMWASYNFAGWLDFGVGTNWAGDDGFIGVRFHIGADTHYGWIRLEIRDLPAYGLPKVVIKDFAYNATPDEPAITSLTSASTAHNLILNDVSETNTPADLQLTFDKATDETSVSAYRIFLDDSYPYISLDEANILTPDRYTEIIPTGDNITINFNDDTRDVDGNAILPGTEYRAFVLSVADGIIQTVNDLSFQSNLGSFNFEYATINGIDYSVNQINADISAFTANYTVEENNVSKVRAFIADTYGIPEATLLALPESYYMEQEPVLGSNTINFTSDKLIYTSELPVLFKKYYCYLLAFPDTIHSTYSSIYSTSEFMFYKTYEAVPVITNSETLGNITDIHVNFPLFINEPNLDLYKIIVVPEGELLTSAIVSSLPMFTAVNIEPTGDPIDVDLPSYLKTSYNISVVRGQTYQVYVCLKSNTSPTYYTLSLPSEPFTIFDPTVPVVNENNNCQFNFTNQQLTIAIDNYADAILTVINVAGENILQSPITSNKQTFNLSYLPKGLYLANIRTGNTNIHYKFIKH